MLALLLLAQHVLAKDTSKDGYIIKKIESCPDEGYYFKRDMNFNAIVPSCYLCFCQNNGTAICWPRDNRRCDTQFYYHVGRRKREIRPRRSPGFSDIFFRDASRDFFNKRIPEQCKPYESSFSEGCPPADWCIGCTVCDCDANGRWDCHILSFCTDGKGKKQMRKRRGSVRSKIMKRQLTPQKPTRIDKMKDKGKWTKGTNIKTTKKTNWKKAKKINKGKQPQPKQKKSKQINRNEKKKKQKLTNIQVKPKRRTQVIKSKGHIQKKNSTKVSSKYKKQGKSKKPLLKSSKINALNDKDNDKTAKLAKTILQQVMASVEKFINEKQKNITTSAQFKSIKNRSMLKNKKASNKNSINIDNNKKIKSKGVNKYQWSSASIRKANEKLKIISRRKRDITARDNFQDISNKFINTTAVNNATTATESYIDKVDLNNKNKREPPATTYKSHVSSTSSHGNIQAEIIEESNLNKLQKSSKIFLNTYKERNINESSFKHNDTSQKMSATCGKTCELKKNIRKLHGVFGKMNKTNSFKNNKAKPYHFNILTNLKAAFRKLFFKKNVNIDGRLPFRKRKVIKTLCNNIGSCKLDYRNKELQLKLDKLRAEGLNILKSVRVIKGLLKLLNINEPKTSNALNHEQFTDNDIKKLNGIINDEFVAKYGLLNLTGTQKTQIKYIKENTLVFIQSIEKFSYILNDIMKILTNGSKRTELDNRYNFVRNKQNSNLVSDKIKRLTNLLRNYNLLENKFMKRMYDVIETSGTKANNSVVNDKFKKVSVENQTNNNTDTVDIYIKNIFKNLRKLRDLAERMSSKTRKKRSTVDGDNIVEYLLMLIEYIFKQNKPIGVFPVKDGIDLLIDAIKNAPDIQLKKYEPIVNENPQITQNVTDIDAPRDNLIEDENNGTLNVFDQKFKSFEPIDNERDDFVDYKDTNKDIQTSTVPNLANFKEEDDVTLADFEVSIKKPNDVNEVEHNKIDIQNDKVIDKRKEVDKRFEVFVDETAEYDTLVDTTTNKIKSATSSEASTVAIITKNNKLRTFIPDKRVTNSYKTKESNNNKIKLDWIEDNYDNEPELVKTTQLNETTTQMNEVTKTVKSIHDKYSDPVSSMSHEDGERKPSNINSENDYYNKQTNILNSLDDVTEKTFIDSDSREDKYNVDSSPLYFV